MALATSLLTGVVLPFAMVLAIRASVAGVLINLGLGLSDALVELLRAVCRSSLAVCVTTPDVPRTSVVVVVEPAGHDGDHVTIDVVH